MFGKIRFPFWVLFNPWADQMFFAAFIAIVLILVSVVVVVAVGYLSFSNCKLSSKHR